MPARLDADIHTEKMVYVVIGDAIEFSNDQREDDVTVVITELGDVA